MCVQNVFNKNVHGIGSSDDKNLCFRFVELQLMWYGGEKGLMALVGEGKSMRYRNKVFFIGLIVFVFFYTVFVWWHIDWYIRQVLGSRTETKKKSKKCVNNCTYILNTYLQTWGTVLTRGSTVT